MTVKECLWELHNKKNVNEALHEYLGKSLHLYGDFARVRLMMNYFLYYETLAEGRNECTDALQDETVEINDIIAVFLKNNPEDMHMIKASLIRMRDVIIGKMEVLTAYVDRFIVYEYVLNRLQYRFDDMGEIPEDIPFTRDVLQFIFGSGDNVTINENIRFVVGQLPIRMARSHYFDLIKQCLSIYKGSRKDSLDDFLYMFRTSATLYHTDKMGEYFTEFIPVLDELENACYDDMTKEAYGIYSEKLRINASKLRELCDLYMELCEIVNGMCVIADAGLYADCETDIKGFDTVLRGLCDLFNDEESDVWQKDLRGAPEEDKLSWLGGRLEEMEGVQEKLYDSIGRVESALEEIISTYGADIEALGLKKGFIALANASKTSSNGVFVKMYGEDDDMEMLLNGNVNEDGGDDGSILTQSELENITAGLISELKEKLSGSSRMVRRAIMAGTLEKLPVFFQSKQEVADYISSSFAQCDDTAEKYAAKQLILEVMQE